MLLAMLYLVQGLPFGFQVSALPIFLRDKVWVWRRLGTRPRSRSRGR